MILDNFNLLKKFVYLELWRVNKVNINILGEYGLYEKELIQKRMDELIKLRKVEIKEIKIDDTVVSALIEIKAEETSPGMIGTFIYDPSHIVPKREIQYHPMRI